MVSSSLKGYYDAAEDVDDRGINATRSHACQIVAWRFIVRLSNRDAVDHMCTDLPTLRKTQKNSISSEESQQAATPEHTPLLDGQHSHDELAEEQYLEDSKYFATTYGGLNALEIAVVTDSKAFLSQKAVQKILDGLWKGDIVFWNSLNTRSVKEARFYNPKQSDPFCRLRVPLYLKMFEVLFFAAFLFFYYHVLVTKPVFNVSLAEVGLYVWLAAFTYNGTATQRFVVAQALTCSAEIGEFWDAGLTLYAADFWVGSASGVTIHVTDHPS